MTRFQIDMLARLEGPLVFNCWLPDAERKLTIAKDSTVVELWIDPNNLGFEFTQTPFEKHINIQVLTVRVRAIGEATEALQQYISSRTYTEADLEPSDEINIEYISLGENVYKLARRLIDRLVDYAYSFKGQYWTKGPIFDDQDQSQFFYNSSAKIKFNEEGTFRFSPNNITTITLTVPGEERYIIEKDWESLKYFVEGKQRSPLVGHLLSRARELMGRGYRRTSIIEAVSALEIALNDFAKSYTPQKINGDLSGRLKDASVSNLIEKLGFRNTFSIGLPILLSEDQISSNVLNNCRDAIDTRNNLIHNSQRDVIEENIVRWLSNIEECCDDFERLSR